MIETGQAYEETRRAITRICEQADLSQMVPSCPDWTASQLLAHLVGLADDVVTGNVAKYGSEQWTAAQVAQRAGRPSAALLAEWAELAPRLAAQFEHLPREAQAAIVIDAVAHEHDLRGALGLPGHRNTDTVRLATRFLVGGFRLRHEQAELPPITLVAAGERSYRVGRADPVGSVRASLFSLFRSLSGRRTRSEVARFGWSVESEPYLDHWLQAPFSWPNVSLREG